MKERSNISTGIAVSLLVSLSLWSATIPALALDESRKTSIVTEMSDENDRLYDEVWNLISAHYLYREQLRDWNSWRRKYDGRMKTRKDSSAAINKMLASLSDEYTFFRDENATKEKNNQRKKTNVVDHKMLDGQIGYVHITTFNSVFCVAETARALIELNQAHGIILDLRDNCGGSVNSTFDVFSLLTKSGKFVTMKGTTDYNDYFEELRLCDDSALSTADGVTLKKERIKNLVGQKPLVVLVDQNTRSAAEMLAGALRDNGRATIIGSRTYGKGIIQRVWEFPNNTSIKISSARYFLPSGTNIHRVGLIPDLYVDAAATKKIKTARRERAKFQPTDLQLSSKDKSELDSIISSEGSLQNGQLSASADSPPVADLDRMLSEAQMVLKRKLVSLAKP